jgi:hypothetical protein
MVQLADADELQRITGLGDKARFETARGADEEHLRAATGLELVGNGEGGDDVAAGAAAGDEDAGIRLHATPFYDQASL